MIAHTHREQCVVLKSWVSVDEKIVKIEVVFKFQECLRERFDLEPCSKSPQHLLDLCAGGAEVEHPSSLETEPIVHRPRRLLCVSFVKQNIVERIRDLVRIHIEENVQSWTLKIHIHYTNAFSMRDESDR